MKIFYNLVTLIDKVIEVVENKSKYHLFYNKTNSNLDLTQIIEMNIFKLYDLGLISYPKVEANRFSLSMFNALYIEENDFMSTIAHYADLDRYQVKEILKSNVGNFVDEDLEKAPFNRAQPIHVRNKFPTREEMNANLATEYLISKKQYKRLKLIYKIILKNNLDNVLDYKIQKLKV